MWTEDVVSKHKLIVQYMEDLYQGCDVMDLVGKGKKSIPSHTAQLTNAKNLAGLLADSIERKVNKMDKDLTRAHSIADFRLYKISDT
jgi:hypothetical protein